MDLTPEEIELIQGHRAAATPGDEPVNNAPGETADEPPFPQGGEKLHPDSFGTADPDE